MDIEPDIILSIALKEGCVLYFKHDDFKYSNDSHYFVVLNTHKEIDDFLILAYATSQEKTIEKSMKYARPETFITITPADYPKFIKTTYFNCNNIYKITKTELTKKIKEGKCSIHDPLPNKFFSLIRAGVLVSKTVEGIYKKLIYPDYNN